MEQLVRLVLGLRAALRAENWPQAKALGRQLETLVESWAELPKEAAKKRKAPPPPENADPAA